MATDEERRHLEAQHRELSARLNRLKIQKARYGYTADPSIDNEITDLAFSIETIKRQMEGPRLLPEAREAIERYAADNISFLMTTTASLAQRDTKQEEQIALIMTEQYAARQWRLDVQERLSTEDRRAEYGRRRNYRLMLFNLGLMVIMFGSIIWLAAR